MAGLELGDLSSPFQPRMFCHLCQEIIICSFETIDIHFVKKRFRPYLACKSLSLNLANSYIVTQANSRMSTGLILLLFAWDFGPYQNKQLSNITGEFGLLLSLILKTWSLNRNSGSCIPLMCWLCISHLMEKKCEGCQCLDSTTGACQRQDCFAILALFI